MSPSGRAKFPVWIYFVIGVLAMAAIGVAIVIIKSEGVGGFWKRKKEWIEKTQPDASPVIKRVEEELRDEQTSDTSQK